MRLVELFVCLVVGVGGEVTESSGGSGSRAAGSTAFARCGSGGNLSHVQGNSSAVGADVELIDVSGGASSLGEGSAMYVVDA
ncbi:hypothetical protein Pcac1_g23493 [Phytophthora cactorum]|uniref:Secreted protein n=1 Tax=Phytophthora cactorum TaxID=29920 RepID=A0A8T0Y9Q9_9STRA|nr:hypothetical protein Pcac1_g23493 [Phytophthora cactorum]KAG2807138.1 hypothetical protein PC111_g17059 [Phytophthora cactorum]KAG2830746.1 hypothetical protein PC113_g21054 [Phytophthora cactorum]KAG2877939.1 hypothetical protein PC114_g23384 [Phytophthora cactorum]KAG2886053.1 hypothetical protein PC115_g20792 [Phytophthora cactorum]